MKNNNFIESLNNAITGIVKALKSEKNMRKHIILISLLIICCLIFDMTKSELLIIISMCSLVLCLEMINTAVEKTVDLVCKAKNEDAKFIKDVSAGAVLIASIATLFICYIIFTDKILNLLVSARYAVLISKRISHLTVLSISLILLVVIYLKAHFNKGTPLEGGMPSGHAAIAACMSSLIIYISHDIRVALLAIFLFLLVCQSRIKANIHTFKEVLVGGLVGIIISYIIFILIGGIL